MRLKDKVSLITGVDTEVGRAIAIAFGREGSKVAGCCRPAGVTSENAVAPHDFNQGGLLLRADTENATEAKAIVEETMKRFGRLDIIVNSPTSQRILGSVLDVTMEDFNEEVTSNLRSAILLSKFAIPALAQERGGAIINVSSIAAYGVKGRVLRSAGKAALCALTRAMALDHGPQNIRVNAVLIGPLTSHLAANAEQLQLRESSVPLKSLATPEDVAGAVLFLASDEARHITGVSLPIDAGRSLPSF